MKVFYFFCFRLGFMLGFRFKGFGLRAFKVLLLGFGFKGFGFRV